MENNYKIYVHINKINGKIYIGQTKQSLNERFGYNGHGYKGCRKFYNAIKKYGWDNFQHVLLLDNLSSELANIIEEELIKKYDSIDKGYNLTTGGCNGYQTSEESNKLKSISKIGDKNPMYGVRLPQETIEHIVKAREGKTDKEVINLHTKEIYKSMAYASKITNNSIPKISQHCNLKINISHREWLLYEDYLKFSNAEIKEMMEFTKYKYRKVINIKTKETYDNAHQASLKTRKDNACIIRSCNGEVKGGLWMFLDDYLNSTEDYIKFRLHKNSYPNSIMVINLDTLKVYNNAKEASVDCGKSSRCDTTIRKCINGKLKTAFGYRWMDYEDYLTIK